MGEEKNVTIEKAGFWSIIHLQHQCLESHLLSPTESLSTKLEVGFQSALKPYLP
jgi:hypothetical protein